MTTAVKPNRLSANAEFLKLVRKLHLYFGVFIAPALIFFAVTGAVQTLGLHEASANYKPPAWLATLGQIHKKQTSFVPVRRAPTTQGQAPDHGFAGPAAPGAATNASQKSKADLHSRSAGPDRAEKLAAATAPTNANALPPARAPQSSGPFPTLAAKQRQHLPLKVFFVVVSLGLFTSTLTGIFMAYKYDRNKLLVTTLLAAGAILPLLLLRF